MTTRRSFVVLALAVVPLSGCTAGEGEAFAHAAADGLHVHVSEGEGDSILHDIQVHNHGVSKSDFLNSFKENAKQASEILQQVGEYGGCQAVEYRETYGFWPGGQVAATLRARTENTPVTVEVLYAVCKADEAGKSGL